CNNWQSVELRGPPTWRPLHRFVSMLSGSQSMNAKVGFWISAFGALFVAISSSFAAEESTSAQPAGIDPAQVSKGKTLYATNCVHCHGMNMVTPGTVAFDLREFPHDDKARFVNSVTH